MRMREIGAFALFVCLAAAFPGCGGSGSPPESQAPNVTVTFYWPDASGASRLVPPETQTIEVTVTAGNMPTVTGSVTKSQVQNNKATLRLFVPSGTSRKFTARAKDANGTVLTEGSNTVDIQGGSANQISVVMGAYEPQLAVAPTDLSFGRGTAQAYFRVTNGGPAPLIWSCTAPSGANWITSIAPMAGQLSGGASDNAVVTVSRAGLDPGAYSADIPITSNGGQAVVHVSISVSGVASWTPWPMFHHDLQRTGLSLYVGAQSATLKWAFTTGDQVWLDPVIGADGTIYVGSDDDNFYAINPDGSQKWAAKVYPCSPAAIAKDGTIYVGTYGKELHALNPDGTEEWTFDLLGYYPRTDPGVGPDGTVYVSALGLYALTPAGTEKWVFYPPG